jgi:hypothetical protein
LEKHLHDRIISVRGECWDHKTSLIPSLFIEVPVSSQQNKPPCIGLLGVSKLPLSMICLLYFRTL